MVYFKVQTVVNGVETEEEPSHHSSASFFFNVTVLVCVLGSKLPPLSVVTQSHVYSFLQDANEIKAKPVSSTANFFMVSN